MLAVTLQALVWDVSGPTTSLAGVCILLLLGLACATSPSAVRRLRPTEAAALSGQIQTPEGRGLAHARVMLSVPTGAKGWAATTGPDGAFRLPHFPDRVGYLRVQAEGWVPSERWVALPQSDLRLTLERASTLEVRVLDAAGVPVANQRLDLDDAERSDLEERALSSTPLPLTDARGVARLPVRAGDWVVATSIESAGAWRPVTTRERVRPGRTAVVELRLPRSTGDEALAGRVVDGGGRGIANADVGVDREVPPPEGCPRERCNAFSHGASARTAPDGTFRLTGLQPGRYVFRASVSAGLLAFERHVDIPSPPVEASLLPCPVLEGRVTNSRGHPLSGVHAPPLSFTEEDGRFRERLCFAGELVLRFKHQDHATHERRVVLHAGERHVLGDVQLEDGRDLAGCVHGPRGPVEDAEVELRAAAGHGDPFGMDGRESRTGPDGCFLFEHVEQAPFVLTVDAGVAGALRVELPAGAQPGLLQLPAALPLEGAVRDEDGMPLPHAEVRATCEGDEVMRRGWTDARGHFALSGLSGARCSVWAEVLEDAVRHGLVPPFPRVEPVEVTPASGPDRVLVLTARRRGARLTLVPHEASEWVSVLLFRGHRAAPPTWRDFMHAVGIPPDVEPQRPGTEHVFSNAYSVEVFSYLPPGDYTAVEVYEQQGGDCPGVTVRHLRLEPGADHVVRFPYTPEQACLRK